MCFLVIKLNSGHVLCCLIEESHNVIKQFLSFNCTSYTMDVNMNKEFLNLTCSCTAYNMDVNFNKEFNSTYCGNGLIFFVNAVLVSYHGV